jgi:hypothetical protein
MIRESEAGSGRNICVQCGVDVHFDNVLEVAEDVIWGVLWRGLGWMMWVVVNGCRESRVACGSHGFRLVAACVDVWFRSAHLNVGVALIWRNINI